MKIDIIGRGNVATHLTNAFKHTDDVIMVEPRGLSGLRHDSSLYLLAISDNAISETARKLSPMLPSDAVMAHTSGTTSISAVKDFHKHSGVLYPLQTFTKNIPLDYSAIPIFIEGSDKSATSLLFEAAGHVSCNVHESDSEKRRHLHLASVVACNFANHLWTLASDYLSAHDIDFSLLLPLLDETTRKIHRLKPDQSQTGPASRKDTETIHRHMEMLDRNANLRDIYRMMSESIISHTPHLHSKINNV